jgi:DNA-binding NtrC family response regulator
LEAALKEAGGKVVELARRININRSHLQTLLKKHGIYSRDFRNGSASVKQRDAEE